MTLTLHRTPLRRPWAVWLAVLVVLLGALAPTLTHALMLATGQVSQGVEICTSEGPRRVVADAAASADDSTSLPGSATAPAHCPFCLQTTDRGTLPHDPLPISFLVQCGPWAPLVRQAFFYATTHAFAPPPRGPPDFS